MNVYMIEGSEYEDTYIIGIFSSLKKAEQYLNEHRDELNKKYCHPKYGFDVYTYEVNELLKGE